MRTEAIAAAILVCGGSVGYVLFGRELARVEASTAADQVSDSTVDPRDDSRTIAEDQSDAAATPASWFVKEGDHAELVTFYFNRTAMNEEFCSRYQKMRGRGDCATASFKGTASNGFEVLQAPSGRRLALANVFVDGVYHSPKSRVLCAEVAGLVGNAYCASL